MRQVFDTRVRLGAVLLVGFLREVDRVYRVYRFLGCRRRIIFRILWSRLTTR